MGVHQVWAPVDLCKVGGNVRGSQAQAGKANMVVRPVAAVVGAVGRAFALIQFGADQHIDDQAVRKVHAPDLARGQRGMATQFTDDMNRVIAFHHLRVTRNQHPHVMQVRHGAGQGRGDVAQAAGFHQVRELGSDKQDFLSIRILTHDRPHSVGQVGQRLWPSCRLTKTLSLSIYCGTDHNALPSVGWLMARCHRLRVTASCGQAHKRYTSWQGVCQLQRRLKKIG